MGKLITFFIVALLLFLFTTQAQDWTQIGQDIDGEAAGDRSGQSLSLNSAGTIVAIGAYCNNGNGTNAGHVRIYEIQGGLWTQIGQDIDGENANDHSGWSVSLSSAGSVVAIGARSNDGNGTNAGHVRIYENQNGTWTQIGQDIDGEAVGDQSGSSVSLSSDGSIVAIGAVGNDGNGSSAGHVRMYENQGGSWIQIGQDIDGEAADDLSGCSVSLNSEGSIVAIGAFGNDGNGEASGHVRIYENQNGTWVQVGQDIDGESSNDYSGCSVSLNSDGSIVVIGAWRNEGTGAQASHVRIYENQSGTWTQMRQDIDGENANDHSGWSVSSSYDGSIVAIGAFYNGGNGIEAGHVRIYSNIPTQPGNQINVCPNSNVLFSYTAENIDTYQWQESTDGGSVFADIVNGGIYSGATTDTLKITGVTIALNNNLYRCVLTNILGVVIISNAAVLTIDSESPVIISWPSFQTIPANSNCQAILPDYAGSVIATDNCDTNLDITQYPAPGTIIYQGFNTIDITVTDDVGNFVQDFNDVLVTDLSSPEIICPNDQEITLEEGQTVYVVQGTEFDPFAWDNCGIYLVYNSLNGTNSLNGVQISIGTTTIWWMTEDWTGNYNDCSFYVTVYPFAAINLTYVNLKCYLEGSYNGTNMSTSLNPDDIPLAQPYTEAPWNYSGTESVNFIPNTDIVDWVLVELRDTTDAGFATSSSMIAQKAAFIMKDGSIVSADSLSTLLFDVEPQYGLFAVVWHRNHIGVISANPLTVSGGIYTYDFSSDVDQVYGGANGHKELKIGVWGMVAADGNADDQINNTDKNDIWASQVGSAGYYAGDFNMDSQVNNNDKNDLWLPNSGRGGQVPEGVIGIGFKCQVPK